MILLTALGSMLLAIGFLALSRKRLAGATLAFSILLIVLTGEGFIPRLLMDALQTDARVESPIQASSAHQGSRTLLVVFGIGSVEWPNSTGSDATLSPNLFGYSRIFQGSVWWHELKAAGVDAVILVSGGDPHSKGHSEAGVMKRELERSGVPADRIILEDRSRNTYQNAEFSAQEIQRLEKSEGGFGQIWLLTSGFHMKRSLLLLNHFGVDAKPAPSDRIRPQIALLPLALNLAYADLALHEFGGIVQFHVYEWLGLNR